MKLVVIGILGLCLLSTSYGADRPTIESLIGVEIVIEDDFAGQSFTLLKQKDIYTVSWAKHGSGLPVIRTQECKVQVNSKYQFVFRVASEKKTNEFKVSIDGQGQLKVYHEHIRIYIEKNPEKKEPRSKITPSNK